MGRLDDKVAIITGAARGQGAVEAKLFAAEGAKVIVTDILDAEGKETAAGIGDAAIYCHHDVRHEDSWAEVVSAAEQAFGKVDVLVNNAGILHMAPMLETSLDEYMRVIEVNQVSCFVGMKAVAEPMRRAGGGSIVNISSTAGMTGTPGLVAYTASKFAMRGMTKVAALELGSLGIRVNSVHPGGVATPMTGLEVDEEVPAERDQNFAGQPIPRIGQASEVANLALYLASDESSYSTGAEFIVDGGSLAGPQVIPGAAFSELD
ncbi:MAG: glucose 1-dehydrogenase [Myxococcota bacterium]|jgi:3alpha(or 20beta)-hydroxysteroid dehydrogenase|nr:glucose 1-dehydrogenase [Myxococcota bacterium]